MRRRKQKVFFRIRISNSISTLQILYMMIAAILFVLLSSVSCAVPKLQTVVPKTETSPALPRLRADGTRIVNDQGKTILLKGLFLPNNTWGNWVWPVSDQLAKEGKDFMIKPVEQDSWVLTDMDFGIFAGLKCNMVVYDVNFELFEKINPKRKANLDLLLTHVRRFNASGIYVIINFAGSPGLNVNSSGEREKPGDKRLKSMFEDSVFQDLHVEFIQAVVTHLLDEPGVGGYILTDEPFCPGDADGGEEAFRQAYNRFSREIRKIDSRHMIIAQGYNARERNPGEKYWDNETKSFRTDAGEQGITYERKIIPLDTDIPNVAYDIHMFDPWDFAAEGAAEFDPTEVEKILKDFILLVHIDFKAPLFISSYGINRKQPSNQRVKWLDYYHKLFDKYGVSAAYFCYKDDVNPFAGQGGYMGVFGHYVRMDQHLRFENGKYFFKDKNAEESAQKYGTRVLEKYFIRDGKPSPIACMDDDVLDAFQRYWGRL